MRRVFIAAMLALGIAPASAQALSPTWFGDAPRVGIDVSARQDVSDSLKLADRYWSAHTGQTLEQPCPSGVRVYVAPADLGGMAWSAQNVCYIVLTDRFWTVDFHADPVPLCAALIHEAGHVLGHPHDSVPGSVMNPAVGIGIWKTTGCQARFGIRSLKRHGNGHHLQLRHLHNRHAIREIS